MAQHDYVIDNSTGANVRADINSALQAIVTNNSGSSAPSTTYALQTFANTTDSMLQLRNSANNAFVNLRKFDGTLPLPDGSASSPSLFFDDDTNTGVFSSAANTFNVATGGVERMELGATTIFNEGGADVDFRIEGDSSPNLFYVDAGNNRIGIGTDSPGAHLEIRGANNGVTDPLAANQRLRLRDNDSTTTGEQPLGTIEWFTGDSNNPGVSAYICGKSATDQGAGQLIFATGTAGSVTERMRIDSSGNVGIGTSSPRRNFHLHESASATVGFQMTNGNTGESNDSQGFQLKVGSDGHVEIAQMENSHLGFFTNASERMRIDSSGQVGIGTSSPGRRLVVQDTTGQCDIAIVAKNDDNSTLFFGDNDADNRAALAYKHSSDSFSFKVANTLDVVNIDSSGRLFVGRTNNIAVGGNVSDHCFEQITNDGYTLTIHADKTNQRGIGMFYTSGKTPEAYMLCQVDTTNKFIIAGSGNVTNANNSYGQVSDISLKENIVDANSQWDDIKNLRIRNFNFKSSTGYDTHTQIGLVAQEVETVSPKLVDTDKDGIKRVTSSVLYMKAVKCLQEAIAKIEVLEIKVATLEAA